MTDRDIGFETLNAYVDGELSGTAAADVARAAAQDSALAGRIATLREMKAAIADLPPPAELRLPDSAPYRPHGKRALAAGLAAVLLLGVFFSSLMDMRGGPGWPSVLESHHRSWAFSRGEGRGAALPVNDLADDLKLLDLSAARLAYVGRERIQYRDLTLQRIGYEGTRGCRLSLFIVPGSLNIGTGAFAPPLRARVWSQGDKALLLMAEGMGRGRFQELADVIEKALREHRPFDADTRQRLAQARAVSRPCQA